MAILVAHPHLGMVVLGHAACQSSEAPLDEVYVMFGKDEEPDAGLDDFDKASRLNFRDYPSTSLVMIAALSSGLGWMLYKWRGRRRAGQRAVPVGSGETKGDGSEAAPPFNGSD